MGIRAEHKYTFTIDDATCSADELEAQIHVAKAAVGQSPSKPAICSFSYYAGDQRDPSTLTVTVKLDNK